VTEMHAGFNQLVHLDDRHAQDSLRSEKKQKPATGCPYSGHRHFGGLLEDCLNPTRKRQFQAMAAWPAPWGFGSPTSL